MNLLEHGPHRKSGSGRLPVYFAKYIRHAVLWQLMAIYLTVRHTPWRHIVKPRARWHGGARDTGE
ncbi:MAG: hypothetical protein V4754_02145 [Pseudomonadota bacterium]